MKYLLVLYIISQSAFSNDVIKKSFNLLNGDNSPFGEITQCDQCEVEKNKCKSIPQENKCPESISLEHLTGLSVTFPKNIENATSYMKAYDENINCLHKTYKLGNDVKSHYSRSGSDKSKSIELYKTMKRKNASKHVIEKLKELKLHNRNLDMALTLTIAFRESGPNAYAQDEKEINTSLNGGLDYFGKNYDRTGVKYTVKKYVPQKYKRNLVISVTDKNKNEHDQASGKAGIIKAKNNLIAYGAYLEYTKERFLGTWLRESGFSLDEFHALDSTAQKFWLSLAFAGPGGLKHTGPTGEKASIKGSQLGVRTLLTLARKKIDAGEINSLNDWHKVTEYNHMKRIHIAKYTAILAEATSKNLCI